MQYKLIIFDFDGTLADSFGCLISAVERFGGRYGLKQLSAGEIDGYRKLGGREVIKKLGIPSWKLPLLMRDIRSLMLREYDQLRLFNGIPEVLNALHENGAKLAIASSNSEKLVRRMLGEQTASLFVEYACGISLFGKARKLKGILRRQKINPESAILIGDEVRDAESAKEAGVAFGAVTWGYNDISALKKTKPEKVFLEISDILSLSHD